MTEKFLITRPTHDDRVSYLDCWSKEIIEFADNHNIKYSELKGEKANLNWKICLLIILLLLINGCIISEDYKSDNSQPKEKVDNETKVYEGAADPSTVYCIELGYEGKTITNDEGGQYGICIFPDKSECDTWAFFRGKCGQEWSYCEQHGYELKDLKPNEGWLKGGICIDKNTKEDIDTIYNLMDLRTRTICKK